MESLTKQVLEANEQHKIALDQYTRKLQTELDTVNKLIASVENIPDDSLQEDLGDKWCLHADGALKPNSIIDRAQTLNERSPFFAEALRRERYIKCLIPSPFSVSEKRYLEKAIIKENKRLAALSAQAKGEDAFEAVSHLDNEKFLDNIEGINWEYVARDVSVSNNPVRTPQECKVRWLGQHHPRINSQRWSEEEESRLHDLVDSKRESGLLDWEEISSLLETNRTALECIKHYLASTRSTFRWTPVLDSKLREAVEKYGNSNWVLVASSVSPHISANQCQIRYERSLKPEIKRGRFTSEEDELLTKAIEVHGTDWLKVAQAIPGRTNAQCRARYTLSMSSGHAKEPWGAEEDERLRAAINKHGQQWDSVCEEMGATRPQKQYALRYRTLTKSLGAQVKGFPDVPGQSLASPKPILLLRVGTSTSRDNASQAIATNTKIAGSETSTGLPDTISTTPDIAGEDRTEPTIAPAATAGELNTIRQKIGAKESHKGKIPPPAAESDGLMDGGLNTKQRPSRKRKVPPPISVPNSEAGRSRAKSQPRPKPRPTSPVIFPSNSSVNMDIDPISQTGENGRVSDPARIEENLETSQTSPSALGCRLPIAADHSDLKDLEDPLLTKSKPKRAQPATKKRRTSQTMLHSTATHPMTTRASKRRKQT